MDIEVEVVAACNALGFYEKQDHKYHKDSDCLETAKDLIRFLRRDDDTCSIRRQLGHIQVVQNDFLPILLEYHNDEELFDVTLKLLINITTPANLCFKQVLPDDKVTRKHFMEINTHLHSYKEVFACKEVFEVLSKKMAEILKTDSDERDEDERLLLERMLILVRNILHIPTDQSLEQRSEDDANIHDQVLWSMSQTNLLDILLYLATNNGERFYVLHTLEILALMLREQQPSNLASAGPNRTQTEKQREERDFQQLLAKERAEKVAKERVYNARHSRFYGTYRMKGVESITDSDMITHKPLDSVTNVHFDKYKRPRKKGRNRCQLGDVVETRRSSLSIRMMLKEFCESFLRDSYNPMMYVVKDTIQHKQSQENDKVHYFWLAKFLMEFNRLNGFRIDYVSETVQLGTFHFILTSIDNCHEMMSTDKKEIKVWSKRLHYALQAYNELLCTLDVMDRDKDAGVRESSRVLKSNIFYQIEYRSIFLDILTKYHDSKYTFSFLVDFVACCHMFLKLMEHYCRKQGKIMVKKTVKRKATKRRKKKNPAAAGQRVYTAEELDGIWDEVSNIISQILSQETNLNNVTPFDAASTTPIEEQKVVVMTRVQLALRESKIEEGISLLKAAREVWPEGHFGSEDISVEDEFLAVRQIFYADIERTEDNNEDHGYSGEENEEIEMEEEAASKSVESEFEFADLVKRFADPKVLKVYVHVLEKYRDNSVYTNHCIVKMLHRIARDLGYVPMLYQLTLFSIFQNILKDPAAKTDSMKEVYQLAKYAVRSFFEDYAKNKLLVIELLFWKNKQVCIQIKSGYDKYADQPKASVVWTEEEEEEVRHLFQTGKDYNILEMGEDLMDYIERSLTNANKSKRQIVRLLQNMGLIDKKYRSVFKKKSENLTVWTEEDIDMLKALYDLHKDQGDVVGSLVSAMADRNPTRASVRNELLRIGLVKDKSELIVKHVRKSGCSRKSGVRKGDSDSEESVDLDALISKRVQDMEGSASSSDDDDDREVEISSDSDEDENSGDSFTKLVMSMCGVNMITQVEWLVEALEFAEQEITDGDDLDIPLIPIHGGHEAALQLVDFQTLLTHVGFTCPSGVGGESGEYWRLAGRLGVGELRGRGDKLKTGVDRWKEREKRNGQKKKEKPKRDSSQQPPNGGKVVGRLEKLVMSVVNKESEAMKDVVQWLAGIIEEEGNDRLDEDDAEDVPVVPLTPSQSHALSNVRTFHSLLVDIGMRPPVRGQEQYWRMDSHLSGQYLKDVANKLLMALRRDEEIGNRDSAKDVDTVNCENGQQLESNKRKKSQQINSSGESEQSDKKSKDNVHKAKRVKLVLTSEDSDSDDAAVHGMDMNVAECGKEREPLISLDSSDSDDGLQDSSVGKKNVKKVAVALSSSDTDDEGPAVSDVRAKNNSESLGLSLPNTIPPTLHWSDSDDDEDEALPISNLLNRKSKKLVISDDDD